VTDAHHDFTSARLTQHGVVGYRHSDITIEWWKKYALHCTLEYLKGPVSDNIA
jgi:hypothetical protein